MTEARPFGFWMATALVIGGMVGAGIFVLPAQLAPYGWTAIAAWFIGVAGSLVLAWVLASLTIAMPEETGAVAICARGLGPLAGALVGWSYWIGIWSANAVIALTAVRYAAMFWPPLGASPMRVSVGAVALVWLLTLLNLEGAKAAGRFQVVTTALKLLPLIAVVAILAGLTFAGGKQFASAPHPRFDWSALTPALTLAFFALVGFEGAALAAERVRDPARNVVRATLAGLALTGLLYILVCSGVVFALPEAVVAGAPAPIAMFVGHFWGDGAGLAVAAFAVVAAVGALNGWVLLQGEVPLGMARSGLLPRWIGRTSRKDVAVPVLIATSACTSILILSNATRSLSGLMDFMLQLTAAATLWLYIGACLAALRLGIARVAAGIGLAFSIWALIGSGWQAAGWSVVLMLTALPLYWLAVRAGSAEQPAE